MIIEKWQHSRTEHNTFLSRIDNSHNLIQMFLRNFASQKALKTQHIVVNIVVSFEATYCSKFSIEERILSGKSQRKIMIFETLYYLGNSCFSQESDLPLLNLPSNECCVVTRLCGQPTSFSGSSLYLEKVPWLRLVTWLCMPTQAAPRVGPRLNFVITV